MPDTGYIKSYRKLKDGGWFKNHKLFVFWHWCLHEAAFKGCTVILGGQEVKLEPGQFIFTRKRACEEMAMSEQSVRTCMDTLKATNRITIKSTNKFSVITVINWGIYQGAGTPISQQTNHQINQPTTNKQITPIKEEYKNNKNNTNTCANAPKSTSAKITTYPPEFEQFWTAYPKKRSKKAALKAWNGIAGAKELLPQMLKTIAGFAASPEWQEAGGKYIPLPATWLNGERWDDEPPKPYQQDARAAPNEKLSFDEEKEKRRCFGVAKSILEDDGEKNFRRYCDKEKINADEVRTWINSARMN